MHSSSRIVSSASTRAPTGASIFQTVPATSVATLRRCMIVSPYCPRPRYRQEAEIGSGRNGMSWQPEIDALREREALARRMGGADKVKRQHDAGKLTVRERIDQLL